MVNINTGSPVREDVKFLGTEAYLEKDKSQGMDKMVEEHRQRTEPIGYQDPTPSDIMTMELSWDRTMRCMRIIVEDIGTWYFTEVYGKAQVLSSDDLTGKMYIRATPLLEGEVLYLYRDPDTLPHEQVKEEDIKEILRPTNNRTCYFRDGDPPCWRVRDERMPWLEEASRRYVSNYVGDIAIEWNQADTIAHIFHKGQVILSKDDVAHFYDLEITKKRV